MRNRKPLSAKKVASATTNQVLRYETKPSVYSRTKQLLRELGIDEDTFKFQSAIRTYTRMANHQYLGINS